ncbi:hypothetical protein BH10PSE3_BH10PSE3_11210 [soil metagenome]
MLVACVSPGPVAQAPEPAPAGIDGRVLKEAGWSPLAQVAVNGRQVVRVVSVSDLVARSYVQIEQSARLQQGLASRACG